MIKKKICMIGDFAVGKTSLVKKFVFSIFSDKYLTTVGVKIEKKSLKVENQDVELIIWDIEGRNSYDNIYANYLKGASGYFLVCDGTRKETFDTAMNLRIKLKNLLNDIPFIVLLNKADLQSQWEVTDEMINNLKQQNIDFFKTSAKDGLNVENAFELLAKKLIIK